MNPLKLVKLLSYVRRFAKPQYAVATVIGLLALFVINPLLFFLVVVAVVSLVTYLSYKYVQ